MHFLNHALGFSKMHIWLINIDVDAGAKEEK